MGESLEKKDDYYRKINRELNEKTSRLIQEANDIVNNDKLAIASPDITHPPSSVSTENNPIDNSVPQTQDKTDPTTEDQLIEAISKLGKNAKTRYLAAKLRVLETENIHMRDELRHAHGELDKLSKQIHEMTQEKSRLQRQTVHDSAALERLRKDIDSYKQQVEKLTLEKSSIEHELGNERRQHEKEKADSRSFESRLQRAQEDIQNLRSELEKSYFVADDAKRHLDAVTNENRRLERQKTELVSVFKKQMKLIDVLRRQKMLIEASRALKMTEDEFLKTLDWQMG